MMVPVGGYIHEVDVLALAKFFVALGSAVDVGWRQTRFAQVFLTGFGTVLFIVAQGYDLYAGDVAETHHGTGTSHAQAYKAHPYGLQFGGCHAQGMLLSGRALGCVHYDGALVPVPFGGRTQALCHGCSSHSNGHEGYGKHSFDVHVC